MNIRDFIKDPIGEITVILVVVSLLLFLFIQRSGQHAGNKDSGSNSIKTVTNEIERIENQGQINTEVQDGKELPKNPLLSNTINYDSIKQAEQARIKMTRRINCKMQRNTFEEGYSNTFTDKYIFKNQKAFGKDVTLTYDKFYKKYSVSWTKENGENVQITLSEKNFVLENPLTTWSFVYKNDIYDISSSHDFFQNPVTKFLRD